MVWPVLTNDAYLKQVLPFLKELKKKLQLNHCKSTKGKYTRHNFFKSAGRLGVHAAQLDRIGRSI